MNISEWRVMVVEDEDDSADLLSQLLRFHGAQVLVARNGVECLLQVEAFRPTIIIMDLAMPQLDGWQTMKQLRQNPDLAATRIVAVTAFDSVQVARDIETYGFDAYFPKPIDFSRFIDHLTRLIAAPNN
jgi:CheY-like chemotaxis protein